MSILKAHRSKRILSGNIAQADIRNVGDEHDQYL